MAPLSKVDVVTASGFHVLSRLALSCRGKLCSLISVLSNTVMSGAVLPWHTLFSDLCPFEHCHVWFLSSRGKVCSLSFRTLSRLALSSGGKICLALSSTGELCHICPPVTNTVTSSFCPAVANTVTSGFCPPVANTVTSSLSCDELCHI